MKNLIKIFIILILTFCTITVYKVYSLIESYPHAKVLNDNNLLTADFAKSILINNYITLKDYVMNELDWRRSKNEDSLQVINIYVPPKSLVNLEFNQKRNNLISKFYPILHKQRYKAYHLSNSLKDTSKIQLRNVGMNGDHYINPKYSSLRIRFGNHSNNFGKKAFKNILRRETRKYSFDYFANVVFNQLSEGIEINSEPINFILNGESSPLFLMEDGFDKYLVERNRKREGSIIEVGFNGMLNDNDHHHFKNNTEYFNYNFKSNDTLFTNEFINEMNKGVIPFSKIDKEKLNCLILICFDFFGIHPLYDINLHWYHNPVSNLMEPTIREAALDSKFTLESYIDLRKNDFISEYLKKSNINMDSLRNIYYQKFDVNKIKSKLKVWDDLYQPDFIKIRVSEIIDELNNFRTKSNTNNSIKSDSKTIFLKGKSIIREDLVIKKHETLDISNLKELIFTNNSNLYVYGNIDNKLNKNAVWRVKDGSSSIYIQSNNDVVLKNIDFYGFSNLQEIKNNHYLPSAITFYKTNVTIDNCNFIDNRRGDDYINFFGCDKVLVQNSNFENVVADAVDSDFSNFVIKNSSFVNIGNDGIDASGSNGQINDIYFDKVYDKAISGGELSSLYVKNGSITNSEIGIVSKDGCKINFSNVSFENNKLNVAAYTKKIEYPKAEIYSNYEIKNFLFENNVVTNISDERVEDVYSLMYGNEYGRESK
tara:strand:+ start:28244 stop:30373 length:2130 start_codon:yes stop_codon:yes gene_type:complete